MNTQTENLTLLYGSKRQQLETLKFKLKRVESDRNANPLDVARESRRIRAQIAELEALQQPPTLPPAA